ncbi:MAG: GcrA cell cycle regulator [Devosiaceae bacterium]|nr:GcrA cell cycle regulator [Devosiaceae bacterium]
MAWTDERVSILKKLWMEGLSASQIAGELGEGVTRNAVIGKVHRLKLSGRAKPATSSQRARNTSRVSRHTNPRGGGSSAGGGMKRRPMATPVSGANALSPVVLEQEGIRLAARQEEVFIPIEERIGLLDLTEKTCKWPIGDPLLEDFHFCGHDSDEKTPYCKFHAGRAYHTIERKKK